MKENKILTYPAVEVPLTYAVTNRFLYYPGTSVKSE